MEIDGGVAQGCWWRGGASEEVDEAAGRGGRLCGELGASRVLQVSYSLRRKGKEITWKWKEYVLPPLSPSLPPSRRHHAAPKRLENTRRPTAERKNHDVCCTEERLKMLKSRDRDLLKRKYTRIIKKKVIASFSSVEET